MTSRRIDQPFASACSRHAAAIVRGSLTCRTRPRVMSRFVDVGLDARQRTLGVVVGEVATPDLLEERDRRRARHLLEPDLVRPLGRLLRGRAEHDRGRGEDQELVRGPPVGGEAALHVGEERLARLERRVRREDDVRGGRREVAPVRRVAGLEQHGVTLRSARRGELAAHLEVRARRGARRARIPGRTNCPVLACATTASSSQESHSARATSTSSAARS